MDVDPADIDRYLSGRALRTPSSESQTRRQTPVDPAGSNTARQIEKLRLSVDQANRKRRPAIRADDDSRDDESVADQPTGRQAASQTAYASQSNLRSNRRRSFMEEDPYVRGLEDDAPRFQAEPAYEGEIYDDDDDEDWIEEPAPRSERRRSPRPPMPRPTIHRPNIPRPSLPPSIANADIINDVPALGFIGLSTIGLAAMSILVANRIGTLDPVIATHVSASGLLEHFEDRSTVWHLPLLATMLTLMNLVAAWFVSPLDRFASRFLLAAGLIVQFVAWVALIRILW